jgi:aryl-alcohol dehydrogenase-like predicted oxidoreductase
VPRFENAQQNQRLVDALGAVAAKYEVTPAQLCVAWAIAKGRAQGVTIIPTMGMRTRKHLAETMGALAVKLEKADVAALEAAVPASGITGTRYPREMMAALDSER